MYIFFGGRILKKIAIKQIAEITNTKIKANVVNVGLNGSIVIKGLSIRPHQQADYDDTIIKADTVNAHFSLTSLIMMKPLLKEIKIKNFVFNAQHDQETNKWNTEDLKIQKPKNASGKMPLIKLSGGILQYSKVTKGQVRVAAAVPLDARLELDDQTQSGYRFDIVTAEREDSRKSKLSGFWQQGSISIKGSISSADVPAFETVWTVDDLAGELTWDNYKNYKLKLSVKDINHRQKTYDKFVTKTFPEKSGLINVLHKFFNDSKPAGKIDIELEASGNFEKINESKAAGTILCKDVSIYDRIFPYLIEHMEGRIDFSENQVTLHNLKGVHKDVTLLFNGYVKDFTSDLQYDFTMKSGNMILDKDLYDALTQKHQKLWAMFTPSGLAAVNYNIATNPQTKPKEVLSVELLDVNATCIYFPYQLENLTGSIVFSKGNAVISSLVAQSQGRLTFNGTVTNCGSQRPIYEINVNAQDIPLDTKLGNALSDKQRKLYDVFVLSGTADANVGIFTPEDSDLQISFAADVDFKNSSFKMDPSALIITNASGKAFFTPDTVDIKTLNGKQGEGFLSLNGNARPGSDKKELTYDIILHGKDVKLGPDVFGLLPGPLEKVGSYLQPEGKINYTAELNRQDSNQSSYKIKVECLKDTINCKSFQYPFTDVAGIITITPVSISLENVEAALPKNGNISLNGEMILEQNGFGDSRFQLQARNITFDKQLEAALPEGIKTYYKHFSPAGRFDLDFNNINIFSKNGKDKYIDFDGNARLNNCRFNFTSAAASMTGTFQLKFLYELGNRMYSGHARIAADNLKVKNISLKNLNANASYSKEQRTWSAKDITADFYDGKFTGQFSFKRPEDSAVEYVLQTNFEDVNLNKLLYEARADKFSEDEYSSGNMRGLVNIGGQVGKEAIGICQLEIQDMKIGTISPIAKLLAVLSMNEPRNFAFNKMNVNSYIKGDMLFFDKLDLTGDALVFNGTGWMNLPKENVNLNLYVSPKIEPALLRSLAADLGRNVIQIEVSGDIYDPQIKPVALPIFKDTLNLFGTR